MGKTTTTLVARLHRAIAQSDARMQTYLKSRNTALSEFVGYYYGEPSNRIRKREPFNMIHDAVSAYVPNLVAANPQFRIRSRLTKFRPFAKTLEFAMEHNVREIRLKDTIRKIVFDSMFSFGIAKIGLGGSKEEASEGYFHDVGQFFCDRFDPEDYIIDPAAREREEATFEGNRFRMPLKEARELFKGTENLKPHYKPYGSSGKAEELSRGQAQLQELEEYVELYDIWMPRENVMLTLAKEGEADKPLREVEWEGPERGPYLMLGYEYVPDNVLPLPPALVWLDMHIFINELGRKMKRQSERQKSVLAYEDAAAEDAQRIVSASDSDAIKVNRIEAIKEIGFGGTTPFQEGFVMWLMQMFSRQAGNVNLLGGLSQEARTATEAMQVQSNATARLRDMQGQLYEVVRDIGESMAWYLFTDPFIQIPVIKRMPSLGLELDVTFSEEAREGDWLDYNIDIVPYSMSQDTPEQYARKLMEWWTSVVLPTLPFAEQQGSVPDVTALDLLMAHEMGIREADQLLRRGPLSSPGYTGEATMAAAPQGGSRVNVGVGQPHRTRSEYAMDQMFSESQQRAPKPQAPGSSPYKRIVPKGPMCDDDVRFGSWVCRNDGRPGCGARQRQDIVR